MTNHEKAVQLRQIIQNRFSEKDLRTLCFDLKKVDFEDLDGDSKGEKIMSLLRDLDNRNRLDDVEKWILKHRSDIDFDQAIEEIKEIEKQSTSTNGLSVELEDNTFLKSKVKTRGRGIGLKRLFSWGSEIDISTNNGADTDGE
ncbi:MAG: hypothetical protein ACI9EW_003803 [Cellvibrionaceae bacterium]|jgi:hypothetical protein